MTSQKDLKKIVRARMAQTGESYAAARAGLLADAGGEDAATDVDERVTVAVLSVSPRSARVMVPETTTRFTFRASRLDEVLPGRLAALRVTKRWAWRGQPYASGTVLDVRTDIGALGLEPLPLEPRGVDDPGDSAEAYGTDEPWGPLWERYTGRARPSFEFHAIAWEGRTAFESGDPDENPVADAAELQAAGDRAGATALLMDVLDDDLRCIDAHVHLGNSKFERSPERALMHYEIAAGIGELSLRSAPRDLLLPWALIHNRPYLRALHGLGLCHWRLGRPAAAELVFERIVALNPPDNQGARFCWHEVREGRSWAEATSKGRI